MTDFDITFAKTTNHGNFRTTQQVEADTSVQALRIAIQNLIQGPDRDFEYDLITIQRYPKKH